MEDFLCFVFFLNNVILLFVVVALLLLYESDNIRDRVTGGVAVRAYGEAEEEMRYNRIMGL